MSDENTKSMRERCMGLAVQSCGAVETFDAVRERAEAIMAWIEGPAPAPAPENGAEAKIKRKSFNWKQHTAEIVRRYMEGESVKRIAEDISGDPNVQHISIYTILRKGGVTMRPNAVALKAMRQASMTQ